MAEFLDVHVFHEPDEPPTIWFTDDKGNAVGVTEVANDEQDYGWEMIYRIQHDEIGKL